MMKGPYLNLRPLWVVLFALNSLCSVGPVVAGKQLPNILFLLSDDQDLTVGGMAHMPKLGKLLQKRGVTFKNAFVHTPICCSSRSSILSGKYLHNGGAFNNTLQGNCYGKQWQEVTEQTTFGTLLKEAGYQTSYAGKYLNAYGIPGSLKCRKLSGGDLSDGCKRVPPGWDRWMGQRGNSQYYNYGVIKSTEAGSEHGKAMEYGDDYAKDYFPDLVANFTLKSIKEFAANSKPFLAVASWPTPHIPYTPAPWAEQTFAGKKLQAMRTPSYNASEESLKTKHWMMRWLSPIDRTTEDELDEIYQKRSEALQSLDSHIEMFVKALKKAGVYDNTYIIYTSDNGYNMGQHRLKGDKRQLYENDIRVPFFITGPGVPTAVSSDKIVLNVDIAPTIADMAGIGDKEAVQKMDGTSFLPTLKEGNGNFRKDFLVSYHGAGKPKCDHFVRCPARKAGSKKGYHNGDWSNNTYHCIRTLSEEENTIYCHFEDEESFIEYYDIAKDEWQMHNAINELAPEKKSKYEARLDELKKCSGSSCRGEAATGQS